MNAPRSPRRPSGSAPRRTPRARPEGGDGMSEDGVPEFGRKKKTVKMNPVVAILLFSSPVVLFGVLVVLYINKPKKKVEGTDTRIERPEDPYDDIKAQAAPVKRMARQAIAMRTQDDQEAFNEKAQQAIDAIADLLEEYDLILDPVRDKETGQLPDEYNGYSVLYQELSTLQHDLIKTGGF